jgi:2-oxoglutarate dehydrogenase E2 component (dihydrolipoamide succinyltransferase)
MKMDITVPSVGESVTEAVLAKWYRQNGDRVGKDEPLFVIETDKVTLEVVAEADGVLHIVVPEGETAAIGAVVGTLDTEAVAEEAEEERPEEVAEREAPAPPPPPAQPVAEPEPRQILSPAVRQLAAAKNVDVTRITGSGPGGRVTKADVMLYLERTIGDEPRPGGEPQAARGAARSEPELPSEGGPPAGEEVTRKPMSQIRQRIASRLLEAKRNTAMLTTFNEIDMSRVQEVRRRFKDAFQKKHGVRLGLMSFFIKACVAALEEFPEVNAFIDGKEIVYHHHCHIGVAIGGERGLVVPVIRHVETLSFAEVEQAIVDHVQKVDENRLELSDLEGGTFTITNGGVYGSLLSTPILNMPQSAILGMHKVEDRPVVSNGQVVVRPMMYVALSYDHRIVDGRQAVTFLVRIKECVEDPERIMVGI